MLDNELKSYLLPNLFNAAVRAGAAIMQVYKNKEDYDISIKSDKTPITVADRRAHETIKTYLGPTRIPILSEEGREMRYEERCNWSCSGWWTRWTERWSLSRETTSLRSISP